MDVQIIVLAIPKIQIVNRRNAIHLYLVARANMRQPDVVAMLSVMPVVKIQMLVNPK
jgi:hypothetical protein